MRLISIATLLQNLTQMKQIFITFIYKIKFSDIIFEGNLKENMKIPFS